MGFMKKQAATPLVYFTGDFAEAGASDPCHGKGEAGAELARQQILDIMNYDWLALRKALPGAKVFGCLGNHDSHPGDVFFGTTGDCPVDKCQKWQYDNLTALWGPDLGNDPAALATLKKGAYYATQPMKGLTVVALNIQYWDTQNSQIADKTSSAYAEGQEQFVWLAGVLAAAKKRGDAVHILGHQPPANKSWKARYYTKFMALCTQYKDTIKAQFYGHIHTDQWSLTRSCAASKPGAPYKETSRIKWCSGGGDWEPGNIFGAGNTSCPLVPKAWSDADVVSKCEAACTGSAECLGFTLYDNTTTKQGLRQCCFRTGSVASQPACPTCTARCYAKPRGEECNGEATGVIIPGPSLTEGWPATNPALRLLTFDAESFELLEMKTFYADLHAGNKKSPPSLDWQLEYDFRKKFGMADLSPASFEALHAKMASEGSALWQTYRGQGDGSLFCTKYDGKSAPFKPTDPCAVCDGACKSAWLQHLNGTATPP